MPIRNHPFSITRPGDVPRPYLPITIINPDTEKRLKVIALIDTGADECALPASFAPILGHHLEAGQAKKINTGNGVTIAYAHTLRIEIKGFTTQDVLIDFMPNLYIPLLGVKSFLGHFILTINYPKKIFSLKFPDP
ncbi:MAG: retropepsin-like aspartic protease [Nitrospiria bacterium]